MVVGSSCALYLGAERVLLEMRGAAPLSELAQWFRPAIARDVTGQSEYAASLQVGESGVTILAGPEGIFDEGARPLQQLESILLNWGAQLAGGGNVLHAGAVVYEGRPVLFVAPSGSGKSTMTLAAVDAGASYITDDTTHLVRGTLSGFARAIRFDHIELPLGSVPPYLKRMDLESIRFEFESKHFVLPVYPHEVPTVRSVVLSESPEPAVVLVERGPDSVISVSPLERVKALHESAIVRHGEYEGGLGSGPTYRLSWSNPERAFELLSTELTKIPV